MFFPEAASKLSSRLLNPEPSSKLTGASLDTRTLMPGNLFVAIQGEKTDGHAFLDAAFEKGASGALIEDSFLEKSKSVIPARWKNLIPVPDSSAAFLHLASFYRASLSMKCAAVVGSVGKTSTKEFLAYLLKKKFQTVATEGNLNNHLGLPLTLFRLTSATEVCVAELGTNHLGDIRQLAEVLNPDFAVLTRIAPEHLEGFGSMEQVYEGELEVFEKLRAGSYAVIPDDDPILLEKLKRFPLKFLKVGTTSSADFQVTQVRAEEGNVHFKFKGFDFSFPGFATFLARNAAMAVAAAELFGFDISQMPRVWGDCKLPGGRFQAQQLPGGTRVIFDGYNASPASFEAALKSFKDIPVEGRKILVFSDMLELGELDQKFHEDLGRQIASSSIDYAVGYGSCSKWTAAAIRETNPQMNLDYVMNAQQASEKLQGKLGKEDWVLLKGSRGMRVEEVLQALSPVEQVSSH